MTLDMFVLAKNGEIVAMARLGCADRVRAIVNLLWRKYLTRWKCELYLL